MKLMVVTPYFFPKIGGLENYAYNISKGLREKYGWEIIVVTNNHEEDKYKEEILGGMKIYRLKRWFKISNTPINPLWYFQIKKIIKKEKPDVINAHTPVPFIADVTTRVCGDIPVLLNYHVVSLYKKNNPVANFLIFLYKNLMEKKTLEKSNILLPVSEFVKIQFPEKLRKKSIVLPNSISKKDILPISRLRKKKNKIIFLGSLDKTHSWKGLEQIILAIKEYINSFNKNIELIVVGDGDYKYYYEELVRKLGIKKNIKFMGSKFGKEKCTLIKKSKILIAYPNTSNDAFPTVFLEAWANLVPIIASNIGSIPYIINDRKDGYLIKPNSPKELAEGIRNLVKNNKLCNRLIKNGWRKVKNFTWDKQTSKIEKIIKSYEKLCKKLR